jgi:F-type H+-transporting ATPase subunit delta
MKTPRQAARDAKQLWRLCQADGALDEGRARLVVEQTLESGRSEGPVVLKRFLRLLRLDHAARMAQVESAAPLDPELQRSLMEGLKQRYGPDITATFSVDPTLIAGVRVRIGSDVYDGSVKAGLAALDAGF